MAILRYGRASTFKPRRDNDGKIANLPRLRSRAAQVVFRRANRGRQGTARPTFNRTRVLRNNQNRVAWFKCHVLVFEEVDAFEVADHLAVAENADNHWVHEACVNGGGDSTAEGEAVLPGNGWVLHRSLHHDNRMPRVHAEGRRRLLLGCEVGLPRLGSRFFLTDAAGGGQEQNKAGNQETRRAGSCAQTSSGAPAPKSSLIACLKVAHSSAIQPRRPAFVAQNPNVF
jgi:hypothetical protein